MANNRTLKGRCANFQTLLLAFMSLGIIAAGAAIVSFAMMCRYHLNHLHNGDTGVKVCKAVYRPGDNTIALAEVVRMVLAFVAIVTVFVFCGVCCCYRLSVARDQNKHLEALLGSYNLGGRSKDVDKEFSFYLATALDNQLPGSKLNLQDADVKISLIDVPDDAELASRSEDPGPMLALLSKNEGMPAAPDLCVTVNQGCLESSDSDCEDNDLTASYVGPTVGDVHMDAEGALSLPLIHQYKSTM